MRSDSRPVYVDVRVGVNVSVLISVSLTVVVGPVLVLPFSEVRDAREWKELLSLEPAEKKVASEPLPELGRCQNCQDCFEQRGGGGG